MKNHINHTIKEIQHYLPSQMTLKDFIHHNSLHPFQKYSFYEGIFRASKLFGYKVTLQLGEFRELFALNRIKEKTLERIIIERKGKGKLLKIFITRNESCNALDLIPPTFQLQQKRALFHSTLNIFNRW